MSANGNDGPPDTTELDVTASGIRAAFGAIPFVGAAMGEALSWLVVAPAAKRRDAYLRMLDGRLRRLEVERGVGLQELAASSEFTTIVLQATRVAMGTAQSEKLEALRAALTNAALDLDTDLDQRLMFVRWIDELTVSHLKVLRFLNSPSRAVSEWAQALGQSPPPVGNALEALGYVHPEFEGNGREFAIQLARDLDARGLTETGGWGGSHLLSTEWNRVAVTDFGQDFIAFVTDPLPDDPSEPPTLASES